MKRDMDLIRKIMLKIENDQEYSDIQGYEKNNILFHQKLLIDAGYLEGKYIDGSGSIPIDVKIINITYSGYDFLELLKDDNKFTVLKNLGKFVSAEMLKNALANLF